MRRGLPALILADCQVRAVRLSKSPAIRAASRAGSQWQQAKRAHKRLCFRIDLSPSIPALPSVKIKGAPSIGVPDRLQCLLPSRLAVRARPARAPWPAPRAATAMSRFHGEGARSRCLSPCLRRLTRDGCASSRLPPLSHVVTAQLAPASPWRLDRCRHSAGNGASASGLVFAYSLQASEPSRSSRGLRRPIRPVPKAPRLPFWRLQTFHCRRKRSEVAEGLNAILSGILIIGAGYPGSLAAARARRGSRGSIRREACASAARAAPSAASRSPNPAYVHRHLSTAPFVRNAYGIHQGI